MDVSEQRQRMIVLLVLTVADRVKLEAFTLDYKVPIASGNEEQVIITILRSTRVLILMDADTKASVLKRLICFCHRSDLRWQHLSVGPHRGVKPASQF